MTWFTANQVSVNNGSTIVTVTSGEDISNIRAGDALIVGSFSPVEINRAYVDGSNNKLIELKSAWSDSNQSNAAARVFPTAGDFKEAANALRAATQLTSDQFQTLTDWGTTNGTVTFTDSSGQQYTARSLAKMDADVAEIEATANSLVGSVVLPTKADFEARHEGKYAGAGFVEWGKHHTDDTSSSYAPINQGMWPDVANQNVLLMGLSGTNVPYGVSRTNEPVIYLANTTHHLRAVSTGNPFQAKLKFPPAPDGLDKADGTGRFASLAEAITAGGTSLSASVIHRQDLCILEVFDVNITTSGLPLYPYGNTQFDGTWSGITLADNLVAQGYSAFYVGDTTTKGKGFLPNLTNSAHVKFLQDKDNNCYTNEDGDIIQRQYRIRTIAGLNGVWENVTSNSYLRFSSTARVKPKGQLTNITTDLAAYTVNESGYYASESDTVSPILERGMFKAHNKANTGVDTAVAYNGNCWAIPIALVQRRNQGAYHPYNIAGTKGYGSSSNAGLSLYWYDSDALSASSISETFSNASTSGSSPGAIEGGASRNARPDGKFYDAIYASDVLDLRLSAHKVNAEVTANNDARKAIGGTKRGWEATPFTVTHKNYVDGTFKVTGTATYNGVTNGHERIQFNIDQALAPNIYELSIFPSNHLQRNKVWVVGDNGNVMDAFGFNHLRHADGNCYMWTGYGNSRGNRVYEFNSKFPVGTTITFVIENHVDYYQAETTWTDIVCRNIDDFVTAFPNGCAGQFNPLGLGLSGNQSAEYIELTKKALTTSATMLHTDNQGGSWTIYTPTITSTLNQSTHQSTNTANIVALWNYKTKAKFTESSAVLPFIGVLPKTVFCANHNATGYGNILHQSMFGKVATGVSEWARLNTALTIGNVSVTEANKISAAGDSEHVRHEPITIKNSNNSFAAKYAHYPVNVNGRLGVMWIGQEVKWDSAMDVGDDAISIDPTTTQTYSQGNYYKFNAGIWKGTVFKCVVDYNNGTVDPSAAATFHELPSGDLMRTSSGTVHFKRWDGDGYGDNGTFTVGDNVAVITDDNENEITRATHLQLTQYLYTEGM